MEALPLAVLDRAIQENESALRGSFGEQGLPGAWDSDLAALPRDTPIQKLVLFARLKHYYWLRYEQLQGAQEKRATSTADAQAAVRQLLRREPVTTTLAGRRVQVTGRSYNALAEIAAHHLRALELHTAVEHVEQAFVESLRRHTWPLRRRRVKRRLAFLRRAHARLFGELLAHRRALYAHALTPTGAPATDVREGHPAPWWRETTVEDDARLLLALVEVGPARYERVGEGPARKGDGESPFMEDFGFHSLLTWLEGKRQIEPAALYDQDVGQVLASLRAGTLAQPDLESLAGA